MVRPVQVRWGFAGAYTLIVVAVTVGFFWQAQLIDELHETQDQLAMVTVAQEKAITALRVTLDRRTEKLCDLLLTLVEEIKRPDLTEAVVSSFEEVGIECRGLAEPG